MGNDVIIIVPHRASVCATDNDIDKPTEKASNHSAIVTSNIMNMLHDASKTVAISNGRRYINLG